MTTRNLELSMDKAALYREEIFTDRRVGTIRCLTPVTSDGAVDTQRSVVYVGQAQLMTPMGTIPLSFEITAASLAQAVDGFAAATEKAMEETVRELQELQRESASSLIVPGAGGGPGMGGMGGPSKFKLR